MPRWLNASARRRPDRDDERHVDGARRAWNEVEPRREVRGKVQFMARFRKNRLFLNSSESAIIVINMDGKAGGENLGPTCIESPILFSRLLHS